MVSPAIHLIQILFQEDQVQGSAVAVAKGLFLSHLAPTLPVQDGSLPPSTIFLATNQPVELSVIVGSFLPVKALTVSLYLVCRLGISEEVLFVLKEWDPQDPFSRKKKIPTSWSLPKRPRVALLQDDQLDFFGDSIARKAYDKSVNVIFESGLLVNEMDLSPYLEAAELLYSGPWVAERHIATSPLISESPKSFLPETLKIILKEASPQLGMLF